MQAGTLHQQRAVRVAANTAAQEVGSSVTNHAGNEARLVRAAQSGDQAAMHTLLSQQERALWSVCQGILGDTAEADDAVQETFLHALRALSRPNGFRGQASFRTWLLRIGINICLDWRRRRRGGLIRLHEMAHDLLVSQADPEQATVLRMHLQEALSALPPRHRALLILREQDGYSVAEIAEILGWNPKKVNNELFKARQTLVRWREKEDK